MQSITNMYVRLQLITELFRFAELWCLKKKQWYRSACIKTKKFAYLAHSFFFFIFRYNWWKSALITRQNHKIGFHTKLLQAKWPRQTLIQWNGKRICTSVNTNDATGKLQNILRQKTKQEGEKKTNMNCKEVLVNKLILPIW